MSLAQGYMHEPSPETSGDEAAAPARRLFLSERAWKVCVKTDSDRDFCHAIAPGQNFYHRLLNGEIYVIHDEEKLCLDCATRRGLITCVPKQLRESIVSIPVDGEVIPLEVIWHDDDEFSEPSKGNR
jgi:hypothetical protein